MWLSFRVTAHFKAIVAATAGAQWQRPASQTGLERVDRRKLKTQFGCADLALAPSREVEPADDPEGYPLSVVTPQVVPALHTQ